MLFKIFFILFIIVYFIKRSVWKVPFISPFFFRIKEMDNIKTFVRNTTISSYFLKKNFLVYSGKNWVKVLIKKVMLGYKIGEFSFTKVFGSAISDSMARKNKTKIRAKSSKNK